MPRKEKSAAGRVSLSLVSDIKKIFMFLSAMADNCSNLFLKEYVSNRAITRVFYLNTSYNTFSGLLELTPKKTRTLL